MGNGIQRGTAAGSKSRKIAGLVVRYIVLLAILVILVAPLLWQLSTSLKGKGVDLYTRPPQFWPEDATFAAYGEVTRIVPILRYTINSVIVAVICLIGNVAGATAAGYALAKFQFKGRRFAMGVIIVGIVMPTETILIARYMLMQNMGLNNTLIGIALPSLVSAMNVLLMRNAIGGIPTSLEEAAMIDGANAWERFTRIIIPSVKGTMAVVAIFSFVAAWDDFLWPLLVMSDQNKYTLTIGLNYLQGTFANDPRVVAAGTIIAILPILVLFFALQKYFFQGVGEGGIKG
ncbi:MAG: carbohydrate ABC transporter permease [Bifidobacterium scardovii]|uniref:carbohydrate ABC transporter permease n=1 Tax=Bifidobacterium scardovii TaxID=158787 RepID=UPI000666FE9B|nr:carbohydrate ABC transporter permease [Bifidobacterium scardovii]MBS6946776.1 carbohydrate ABC transporter permease [Bifidobacterium scardovii]MDU3735726.1 carbohydrate ABC transporter permease [Bifidobacterium scardovii]MDU5296533.1 carbohydrate ABC transporter permease [Bifidobacterium scardovii]MDU5609914.1 carbohydrate ABC transporter permease [Bifidobacterium scardovii]MDU5886222.1 carbohydrate ABC transporter permease [Bifidobacterium scardovii]